MITTVFLDGTRRWNTVKTTKGMQSMMPSQSQERKKINDYVAIDFVVTSNIG